MTEEFNVQTTEEAMEIPEALIGLSDRQKKLLHKWLSRRYYAIHMLQRAARYVEGYLDDFILNIQLDRSSINPKLVVEVKMDQELPMDIAHIVYKHMHELMEIFDYLNEQKRLEKWRERKKKIEQTLKGTEGQMQALP